MGLSATTAIKIFIAKFNRDKDFDFPVTLNRAESLPEEVEMALLIAKAEEYGLLPDKSASVSNISELRKRGLDE